MSSNDLAWTRDLEKNNPCSVITLPYHIPVARNSVTAPSTPTLQLDVLSLPNGPPAGFERPVFIHVNDMEAARAAEIVLTTIPSSRPDAPPTEAILPREAKDILSALPGFPGPSKSIKSKGKVKFERKLTDAHRSGLRATDTISVGEVIFQERPLALCPGVTVGSIDMLQAHIGRMTPFALESFSQLTNRFPASKGPMRGIYETNAIAVQIPGCETRFGVVCGAISTLSRSCRPNAEYTWDAASLTMTLRAIWPILPGEDITVRYFDGTQPGPTREQRQKWLDKNLQMTCRCGACYAPDQALSDRRRTTIQNTSLADYTNYLSGKDTALRRWLEDPHAIREHAAEMISYMVGERFYGPVPWFYYYQICVACAALGDVSRFTHWAKQAAMITIGHCGHDGGWNAFCDHPEKLDIWDFKKKSQACEETGA